MVNYFLVIFLLIINNFIIIHKVYALKSENFYVAEIEIPDEYSNEQQQNILINQAFNKLLTKVLSKQIDIISIGINNTDQYISNINKYNNQDEPRLTVYFNKDLINKMLTEKGYNFLPELRPVTIILPQNTDLNTLDLAQNLCKEISRIGKERGLSIIYPIIDLNELEILRTNQSNQNIEHLLEISKKYHADEVITINFQGSGDKLTIGWRSIINNWQFSTDNIKQNSNSYSANLFVDQFLEYLLSLYANNSQKLDVKHKNEQQNQEIILINISNIINLEDYVQVEKYLQSISIIASLKATKFAAGKVQFELIVNGNKQTIKDVIATSSLLKEVDNKLLSRDPQGNKLFYILHVV